MSFLYFGADVYKNPDVVPSPASVNVTVGPNNRAGVLTAHDDGRAAFQLTYVPGKQTWRPIPNTEYWIGWYNEPHERYPTPNLLKRPEMQRGVDKQIFGQTWHIPKARKFVYDGNEIDVYNMLERFFDIDTKGEWTYGDVVPRARRLFEATGKYMDHSQAVIELSNDTNGIPDSDEVLKNIMSPAQQVDCAIEVLATNYRVGRIECAALRMMTLEVCHVILQTALGLDDLDDLKKKGLLPDTSSTTNGSEAETEVTHQPTPT